MTSKANKLQLGTEPVAHDNKKFWVFENKADTMPLVKAVLFGCFCVEWENIEIMYLYTET